MSGGRIAVIVGLLVIAVGLTAVLITLGNRRRAGATSGRAAPPPAPAHSRGAHAEPAHYADPLRVSVGDIAIGVLAGMWLFVATVAAVGSAVAVAVLAIARAIE